jgi:signal transduction histidine kinase
MAASAEQAGVCLDLKIEETLQVAVHPLLEILLENLLSNAIKYAAAGQRVLIRAHAEGPWCACAVQDSGPGIEDAHKTSIFRRFSRHEKSGIRGSGYGLAISKKIAELHGGTIRVTDNPGGGAIFTVLLPLLPPTTAA